MGNEGYAIKCNTLLRHFLGEGQRRIFLVVLVQGPCTDSTCATATPTATDGYTHRSIPCRERPGSLSYPSSWWLYLQWSINGEGIRIGLGLGRVCCIRPSLCWSQFGSNLPSGMLGDKLHSWLSSSYGYWLGG